MTARSRVGSDVRAICRRCGPVWHVVIALDGERIAQVECGDCRARHRYRPVGDAPEGATTRRSGSASARSGRQRRTPVVEADPSKPRRPFRTSDTYAVGDRVVHTHFGEGVVQAITGPKKVEVLFASGPRTLVHGRDAG